MMEVDVRLSPSRSPAQHALDLAGSDDHLARGAAAGFLGLAAWTRGDLKAALQTFTQAVASQHASGNLVDALGSTVVLADMWLAAGRPGKARRLYEEALHLARTRGAAVARATADLHVGLGGIDCEAGDFAGAGRHLKAAADFLEHAPMTESRHRWFVARALMARAQGRQDEACVLLDHAEQLYRRGFFPDVRPIAAARARIWIAQGKLTAAAGWAHDRGLSVSDEASYQREFEHLTLVRLRIAQHRADPGAGSADDIRGLLDRLLDAAETSGRAGSTVEIRVLLALAHDAHGRRHQARETLGQALAEAPEPGEYIQLFLAEGVPMLELLRDASRHGIARSRADRLLGLGTSAAGGLPAPAQGPPSSAAGKLSERELQVLRLLDSELSGPQIADQLFISHNTLRTHTKHIFTKLEVTSRRAAVRQAHDRGLM
jgi:LuxR family maltose regulon positive regulatory protein